MYTRMFIPKIIERRTPKKITNDCATSVQITAFIPPLYKILTFINKSIWNQTYNTRIKCTNNSTWNRRKPNLNNKKKIKSVQIDFTDDLIQWLDLTLNKVRIKEPTWPRSINYVHIYESILNYLHCWLHIPMSHKYVLTTKIVSVDTKFRKQQSIMKKYDDNLLNKHWWSLILDI